MNHKENKLSFKKVLCARNLIANDLVPNPCPIFLDLSEGD